MIGRLTGVVAAQEAEGVVILDVGGVGYEVLAPLGTIGRAPTDSQGRVTLKIHTHVREDTLSLFGFASDSDRLAFRTLISVSNVGPKTAIGVLSALPAAELGQAIAARDLGRLTAIPGIGKKTAERLVLELKDKLPARGLDVPVASAAASSAKGGKEDILAGALTNMGYRPSEAERAIAALSARLDVLPLPDLVREALGILAR